MSDLYASSAFAARIRELRESIRAGARQGEATSSPPITFYRVEASVIESDNWQSSDTLDLNHFWPSEDERCDGWSNRLNSGRFFCASAVSSVHVRTLLTKSFVRPASYSALCW